LSTHEQLAEAPTGPGGGTPGARTAVTAIVVATAGSLPLLIVPGKAQALIAAATVASLALLSAIDIERRTIPNRVVLPCTVAVLALVAALAPQQLASHALGAVVASLLLLVPHALRPGSLGAGDVKLALLIGAGAGPLGVFAIGLAFLFMFPAALVILLTRGLSAARTATLPFAPFLSLAALIVLIIPHLQGTP
jgi:leader peptidase (prepilin peptidase)/N-methyltransferase